MDIESQVIHIAPLWEKSDVLMLTYKCYFSWGNFRLYFLIYRHAYIMIVLYNLWITNQVNNKLNGEWTWCTERANEVFQRANCENITFFSVSILKPYKYKIILFSNVLSCIIICRRECKKIFDLRVHTWLIDIYLFRTYLYISHGIGVMVCLRT